MSVILTTGKKAAQKFKEQEKAKSAQRIANATKAAQLNIQKAAKLLALANVPKNSYMPSESTIVWNLELDGTQYSLALRKNNMSVWCNDARLDVQHTFDEDGSVMDFEVASHKARIKILGQSGTSGSSSGHQRSLTQEEQPLEESLNSLNLSGSQLTLQKPRAGMDLSSSTSAHDPQCDLTYELTIDGDLKPQSTLLKVQ